jgi:large subunit ribosomal protein L15
MQLNTLKRTHKHKRSMQVGRGGKRGKTSGRGGKGQTARAGHKARPEFRDIIKRLPKLRGYDFKSFEKEYFPVNLSSLEKNFKDGEILSPKILAEKVMVKILGDGEITKKLSVEGCAFSKSAKEKIEKVGGTVR